MAPYTGLTICPKKWARALGLEPQQDPPRCATACTVNKEKNLVQGVAPVVDAEL